MLSLFITGATGCVGHYVLEQLLRSPHYQLYALVRDKSKLRLPIDDPRLTIVEGDLDRIQELAPLLAEMDGVIHLAAAWGDAEAAQRINVARTLQMFRLLNPDRCRRILYFSSASLLDRQAQPLPVAGLADSAYIRSKYEMLTKRADIPLHDRLITLYPTLLFGGSPSHPYSHITAGLKDVTRWLGLIRWLSIDASFHFIHAEDIARIVVHLLEQRDQPISAPDLVLGNPRLTFDQTIEQFCGFYKQRIWFRIPFPIGSLSGPLSWLFRVKLSVWDRFCIGYRHFTYPVVSAESLGLPSRFQTLEKILSAYG